MRRLTLTLLCVGWTVAVAAQELRVPNLRTSVKFAVIGNTGSGDRAQRDVATQLTAFRAIFPFELVVMLGDNIDGDKPKDYVDKFEQPYKSLLEAGVKFYAALGNHDNPNQRFYKLFNMTGKHYYAFTPAMLGGVHFFVLDSSRLMPAQVEWLDQELAASGSDWKILLLHHPLYSSGDQNRSNVTLRERLEPVFLEHRVNVVLTGHDHIYERLHPQTGIVYFAAGSSAKPRRGSAPSALTAKAYAGHTFMLVEIEGNDLHFQAVNERGVVVDHGIVRKDRQISK